MLVSVGPAQIEIQQSFFAIGLLSEDQKWLRMDFPLQHLTEYKQNGDDFLLKIITGEETCYHYFESVSKLSNKQNQHHQRSLKHNILFFDHEGHSPIDFKEPLQWKSEQASIRWKRPGKLLRVNLLHGSAGPHVSNLINENIQQMKWRILEYPPYCPGGSLWFPYFYTTEKGIK